jgi:hypothetical protein
MKTFNRIEFDGETITVHGVGTLGYSESFDLDSFAVDNMGCPRLRGERYVRRNMSEQTTRDILDVAARIIYAKNRLVPAERSFKQLMEVLAV